MMKKTNLSPKNILLLALSVALILLLPLVGMQFTREVAWSAADFILAGGLLFGAGLAYLLLAHRAAATSYRLAVGVAIATALLLIWVNLAVGIIGSEDNPANRMYAGVLAVFILGALAAQFRAPAMALALVATALAQAVVTAIALFTGQDLAVLQILMLNGFFIALWGTSAYLFLRAPARPDQQAG